MISRDGLIKGLIFILLIFTSCSKEDEKPDEGVILASYLESSGSPLKKDYVNTDLPSIITADEVKSLNDLKKVYIIDIRAAMDFNAGHIPNAHNTDLTNLVSYMHGVDTASCSVIAIVCYNGQTSAYAASLLRLSGYSKVYSLQWGMCSWHPDFAGRWKGVIAKGNTYADQFSTTPSEKGPKGRLPDPETGKLTGKEIWESRLDTILSEGSSKAFITAQSLFSNLTGYYIIHYCSPETYANPGHVPGAVQYTPLESIKLEKDLKTIPSGKPVAVYCSSGQTSAYLVAYLRILGYNAKSVLYGTNGMIYNKMAASQMGVFSENQVRNYPYVQN